MKKILFPIIGLLVVGILSWMGYTSLIKLDKINKSKEITQNFNLLTKRLGLKDVSDVKPSIFIYFNSDCHYCQWEMQEIQRNENIFRDNQLLLASFEPKKKAIDFLKNYNLAEYYIEVNPDTLTSTITGGVPQIFIYQNGLLKKHYKGEVKIEAISEVLNQ